MGDSVAGHNCGNSPLALRSGPIFFRYSPLLCRIFRPRLASSSDLETMWPGEAVVYDLPPLPAPAGLS